MNHTLKTFVIACAAVVGCAAASPAQQPARKPNVIVIVADDVNPEWMGFRPEGHGKSLTPRLNQLAQGGTVLSNLHSPSPICTPSRFTLMTGKYPSRATNEEFVHETQSNDGQTAVGFNTFIEAGDDNLARRFKNAGYVTGAVGKNHFIDVPGWTRLKYKTPLDAPGTKETLAENARKLTHAYHDAGFDHTGALYYGNADADGINELAAHNQEWITDAALKFIDQSGDKPFFLYFATTIPHGPQDASRSWKADPRITPDGLLERPVEQCMPARNTIQQRLEAAGVKGWNRENVLWLDDAVGAVVDKLQQRGVKDDTIIVFVSDHGTESKGSVYRRGTNTVGFIWRNGGFPVGSQSSAALLLTDLGPTLLDLCNVGYQADAFDGRSAAPVLAGAKPSVRDGLYLEVGYTRAVVKDGWKFLAVRYPKRAVEMPIEERQRRLDKQTAELTARGRPIPTTDPNAPFSHLTLVPGGADAEQVSVKAHPDYFAADQLYNLNDDPDEQHNLIGDPANLRRVKLLEQMLDDELRALGQRFGEFGVNGK